MAKDFKSKLKQDPKKVTTATESTEAEAPVEVIETKPKKKVGRPKTKTEDCKAINIAVPLSVLEKMEVAKVMYRDNLTLYVNRIIEKDLEANYDKYKQFADMQADALK